MVCGLDYGVLGQNQVSGSRKQSGYSSHSEDLTIGYLERISFLAAENNHVTAAKVKIRDGAWT